MKFLPKIEETRLMTRIARLQSNTDFVDFKTWLLAECEVHIIRQMIRGTEDKELHQFQGILQTFEDLRELFTSSEKWSLDMQALDMKKLKKKQGP